MNFKEHFKQINLLLREYEGIWKEEILNFYPRTLGLYPTPWVNMLDALSTEELWKIDGRMDYSPINDCDFNRLVRRIQELELIPEFETGPDSENPPPPHAFWRVSQKKKHEILKIGDLLNGLQEESSFSQGVDIGGGVGHLARTLAHYYGIPMHTLDLNKDFQERGEARSKKYLNSPRLAPLNFIHQGLYPWEETSEEGKSSLLNLLRKDSLTVGLHTCGGLALHQMKAFNESKGKTLLNFGCCYLKMDPVEETHVSEYAKTMRLDFTTHTLTLATRSHHEISFDEYLMKEKVKSFRYTLHLFHYHELGLTEFREAGESPKKLYLGKFSDYALNKLEYWGIDHSYTAAELDSFFEREEIKALVRKMFLSNIIRWQFGKLIEVYLLLDRCIYLEENGHKVELMEVFDPIISPRNMGILAQR